MGLLQDQIEKSNYASSTSVHLDPDIRTMAEDTAAADGRCDSLYQQCNVQGIIT